MSFLQSNINSGNFNSVSLSGTNGIAGSFISTGISYTTDSGENWLSSTNTSGGGQIPSKFNSVYLSGSNGIAGSADNFGIWYTLNSGQTWTQSPSVTIGDFYSVILSGQYGIACSYPSSLGIFYTQDYGQTWTQSNLNTGGLITGNFFSVSLSGQYGLAGNADSLGIFYSQDYGQTWTQSSISSGYGTSVYLYGQNGIASYDNGIVYSSDGGVTWLNSNITDSSFTRLYLYGLNGNAASSNGFGLLYTENSGQTWQTSNITTGNFGSISLSGSKGIAGSFSSLGIFYTQDYGKTWTQSNINTGSFYSVSIFDSKGIAGGGTNNGIFYSSSPVCFEKNTLILVLENNVEVYKKICELKVGDLVKTYKEGYKKIKIIKSFTYNFVNIKKLKKSLYKMKDHDIIVTGKHGILVDELTEEENINIKKCRTKIRYIEDKKVLPACASDKFERIISNREYELWHFALENVNVYKNYGIHINDGILSESCSEAFIMNQ
jgi:photosystem II stability/assembly factor-like uncharacterized protein